jgi:hypothetical protein
MSTYPSGVQSFREIREEKCLYADKTEYIHRLLMDGRFFCLFRPRGFGKTLFISALKELFEGNVDIFLGLFIHGSGYDFVKHPVISLDLSAFDSESPGVLREEISWELKRIALKEELLIRGASPGTILSWLIDAMEIKYRRKVVVLIDEVDSPVTSRLSDPELAYLNASVLEAFLAPLASKRDKIRFCFVTGEIKHSREFGEKISPIFKDVSLGARYGGICGITQEEFFRLFKDPLGEVLDVLRADGSVSQSSKVEDLKSLIVRWYGGYSFDGELMLIDPGSLMPFMENSAFDHYFSDLRLNPFFVSMINRNLCYLFPDKDLSYSRSDLMTVRDIREPSPGLLTQKGVYTLSGRKQDQGVTEHTLSFPNFDAERSFHLSALEDLTGVDIPRTKAFIRDFEASLKEATPELMAETLKGFLLKCPFEDEHADIVASNKDDIRANTGGKRAYAKKIPRETGRGRNPELSPSQYSAQSEARVQARSEDRNHNHLESEEPLRGTPGLREERAIKEGQRLLNVKIVKVLSLIMSLSGFKLRSVPEDELSVQGFLKQKGDKTVILNLSYLKGGFELPPGGRKKLIREALSDTMEKVNESKETVNSLVPQEIKEIFLYLTGGSETLAGVLSRQGGFYWRPLSKAPGSSS